ncbi:hypothetical protein [Mesorhizobium sp. Root695]|nr:hypothetical protein [Mesorhizobium sp. Root695]
MAAASVQKVMVFFAHGNCGRWLYQALNLEGLMSDRHFVRGEK